MHRSEGEVGGEVEWSGGEVKEGGSVRMVELLAADSVLNDDCLDVGQNTAYSALSGAGDGEHSASGEGGKERRGRAEG